MSENATTPVEPAEPARGRQSKRLHFGITLILSYLIVCLAAILYHVVWTSDRWSGALQGLQFSIVIVGFLWFFLGLPWCLMVWVTARKAPDGNMRTTMALGPSLIVLAFTVFFCIRNPGDFRGLFEQKTGVQMSPSFVIKDYDGFSGLAGSGHYFRFSASPQDMAEIIRKLDLKLVEDPYRRPSHINEELKLLYKRYEKDSFLSYTLRTNLEHTEGYFDVGK